MEICLARFTDSGFLASATAGKAGDTGISGLVEGGAVSTGIAGRGGCTLVTVFEAIYLAGFYSVLVHDYFEALVAVLAVVGF